MRYAAVPWGTTQTIESTLWSLHTPMAALATVPFVAIVNGHPCAAASLFAPSSLTARDSVLRDRGANP